MFLPSITPEGIAQEIASRMIGARAVAINDLLNAFRNFPAMYRLMNVLLNPVPGQSLTIQELNSAMTELLTVYNRNTENNPNLNPAQKAVGKLANQAFVSMVYDSIVSRLRMVSY